MTLQSRVLQQLDVVTMTWRKVDTGMCHGRRDYVNLSHPNEIETEHHLLNVCTFYKVLKTKYHLTMDNDRILLEKTPPSVLGKYLVEALLEINK